MLASVQANSGYPTSAFRAHQPIRWIVRTMLALSDGTLARD
jgi:hypothetical protein